MADPDLDDLERRMKGAEEALRHEFAGLRTGRASIGLLEPVTVDVYGAQMPLNQVGTIGVPEPRRSGTNRPCRRWRRRSVPPALA